MPLPRIICVAGGSGAGKSTLADGIAVRLGERVSLLHLDDYQKTKEFVPVATNGRRNYDHPCAVDFHAFIKDLAALAGGSDIRVMRREKRKTVDAGVSEGAEVTVFARPIVIVEGYLALWHPSARRKYDFSIFLDLPEAQRIERRRWAKDKQYVEEVLLLMHDLHIEPTKAYADFVIPVARFTENQVINIALGAICP